MKTLETSETRDKVMTRTEEVNVLVATLRKKEEEIYEQEMKSSGQKVLLNTDSTVICNGILLWVSSQLDAATETNIYNRGPQHFLTEEIEKAKNFLFIICGGIDTAIGVAKKEKEGVKRIKKLRIYDIVEAIMILRQNETEPIFISTMKEILECPAIVPLVDSLKEESLMARMIAMESLLETFMNTQNSQNQIINKQMNPLNRSVMPRGHPMKKAKITWNVYLPINNYHRMHSMTRYMIGIM